MSFYEMFVKLCEMRGAAPSTIADKAGLDKSVVSYWKKHPRAKIKLETLQRIANALKVPVYSLMTSDTIAETSADIAEHVARYEVCLNLVCDSSEVPNSIKEEIQNTRPDKNEVVDSLFALSTQAMKTNSDAKELLSAFDKLNNHGQSEAAKRIKELSYVPDYKKEKNPPTAPEEAKEGE